MKMFGVTAALAVACASCGGSTQLKTSYTPDYAAVPHQTVSVLGVYRDGRMSLDAWTDLGPPLSRPLTDGAPCAIAFSKLLMETRPALASAIDDYARENGVTDELVDRLATTALGETVLVVQVWGRIPEHKRASDPSASQPAPGRGRRGAVPQRHREAPEDALEMSAALFSRSAHHAVALVSLKYTGDSVDEALRAFGDKLGEAFPGMKCVGWSPDASVDAESIRKLPIP